MARNALNAFKAAKDLDDLSSNDRFMIELALEHYIVNRRRP